MIQLCVLIVEDSEDDAILLLRELRRGGYEPVFERVETPSAMENALAKHAWDVVISDYVMPCFSGPEALKLLQQSGYDIPFIIVSGKIGEDVAVEAMKAGAHDYIIKGNLARLIPAIERELREAAVRRERKAAEKELKESEERFRAIFDNASDGILVAESESKKFYIANKMMYHMLGYDVEEFKSLGIMDILHTPHIIEQLWNRQVTLIKEVQVKRKDNSIFYADINLFPITLAGEAYLAGIFRDITERRLAEEQLKSSLKEKDVLLREIHHRVKNNMQIISSLLRLESESNMDEKAAEMFKESQNRIMSMALIHEKLYQSKNLIKIDTRDYIEDMVNGLFQCYAANRIALDLDIDDVSLGIDSAISCGLIINELVTNSLKYAFPEGKEGEIKIALHAIDGNVIELAISDNGIGIPEYLDLQKTKSLGLQLVTMLAENQLRGVVSLNREKGTRFRIKFKDVK